MTYRIGWKKGEVSNMRLWIGMAGLAIAAAMVAVGCQGDSAEREKTIREEASKAAAQAKAAAEAR